MSMEKQIKVKTGKSLSKLIENIVNETLKSNLATNAANEKEKQTALSEEDNDLFGGDDKKSSTPDESKTVADEKEKLEKGEISSSDIVDKLNTIRSGKSFKDEVIARQLEEYVESLSKAEKVALLAFLKGLAQIVTGEIPADDAVGPGTKGADVSMEKSGEKKSRTVKPNVIKTPEKEKTEKKPSSEDTSGPVPITAKKK